MIFILLFLSRINGQFQVPTTCSCDQYLSQADCTSNYCDWNSMCTQPSCSNYGNQKNCNTMNQCAWSVNDKCISVACNQLNSTSSGGCSQKGCGQSSAINLDGTYNCSNAPISGTTVCYAQDQAQCIDSQYCFWNTTSSTCKDATCQELNMSLNPECQQTLLTTTAHPIIIACSKNGTQCQDVNFTTLISSNCNSQSMNSYTWSTHSIRHVKYVSGL